MKPCSSTCTECGEKYARTNHNQRRCKPCALKAKKAYMKVYNAEFYHVNREPEELVLKHPAPKFKPCYRNHDIALICRLHGANQ
jgi:hypothetical protein